MYMKEYILGEFKSLNRSQYLEGLVFTIVHRGYPNKKNTKNKKVVLISGNSYLGQQHQKTEGEGNSGSLQQLQPRFFCT